MAESLLPGTDAIKSNTVEWDSYRGGYLVRWKNGNGIVRKITTKDWNEADRTFTEYREAMRAEAQGGK